MDEIFLIIRTLTSNNYLLKVYRFILSIANSQGGRQRSQAHRDIEGARYNDRKSVKQTAESRSMPASV